MSEGRRAGSGGGSSSSASDVTSRSRAAKRSGGCCCPPSPQRRRCFWMRTSTTSRVAPSTSTAAPYPASSNTHLASLVLFLVCNSRIVFGLCVKLVFAEKVMTLHTPFTSPHRPRLGLAGRLTAQPRSTVATLSTNPIEQRMPSRLSFVRPRPPSAYSSDTCFCSYIPSSSISRGMSEKCGMLDRGILTSPQVRGWHLGGGLEGPRIPRAEAVGAA